MNNDRRKSLGTNLLPYWIGLAATGLAMAGCPGDDSAGDGIEQGSGTTGTEGTTSPDPDSTGGDGTTLDGADSSTSDGALDDESTGTTGDVEVCPYEPVEGTPAVTLELVGEGFDRPMQAIGHPTEPDRLFVVERGGRVRILEPGSSHAPEDHFLSVNVAGAYSELINQRYGLMGFAFHPDFPEDPRVYVSYNPPIAGTMIESSVISEFTLDPEDPDRVDSSSERIILELEQPYNTANGGMIDFGPDGYLYIAMGYGGGSDHSVGRDTQVLLAKVLRIGVEPDGIPDDPLSCMDCSSLGPFDYTIPDDNPFVDDPAFAPEIYAWGVRDPSRYARDPSNGLIYAGDANAGLSEVTLVEAGADLGWNEMVGFHCIGEDCDESAGPNEINQNGMTAPLLEYGHAAPSEQCGIIGGGVYRSCEVPAWDGTYFFSDYCGGDVFGLRWDGVDVTDLGQVFLHDELMLGNGWNSYGDVFITTAHANFTGQIYDGRVYRIAPDPG